MNRILTLLCCVALGSVPPVAAFYAGEHVAQADTPQTFDAGVMPAAELGSALPAPAPQALPSDAIPDPVAHPTEAIDGYKAAKKVGWGAALLFVVIVACLLLSKAGGIFKPLASPRVALCIGLASSLALTAYNAVMQGGTWYAALGAAAGAGFAFWNSQPKPKQPDQPPSATPVTS